MAGEGSIVVPVEFDDSAAQAELNRLHRKIDELDSKLKSQKAQRTPLADSAAQAAAELDVAKAKLEEMQNSNQYTAAQIEHQADNVRLMADQYNKADAALQSQDKAIKRTEDSLNMAKDRAGELVERLSGVGDNSISGAMVSVGNTFKRFEKRILGLARRVFVFTLITKALRGVREVLWNGIKANDEASAAVARLKGALLTLAQPIIQVVIPVFTALVNVLTQVVTAIAHFFALLTGTTLQDNADAAKALSKSMEKTGGSAKKAGKELAKFDEINKLGDNSGGSGGGIKPDFSGVEQDEGTLKRILDLVELIGAAFAGWRIGAAFGKTLFETLGIILAIYSAIEFVKNIFDMWNNGITLDNLTKALIDLLGMAVGLGAAFGAVGAGIALVVGGLTLLATGFKDAFENGINLANTMTIIAGIVATGLGLALLTHLTHSLIPLFIAGLAAALVALAYFTGHGEELMAGLKQVFDGFIMFLNGVFTQDWEKAMQGLKMMGEGFKTAWNAIVDSVKSAWDSFVKWFDEKTNGKFRYVLDSIEMWVKGKYEAIKQILSGLIDFIAGVFTQDWDRAWKGIQNIFIGIINAMITAVEGAFNFLISALNGLIQGFNWLMNALPGGLGSGTNVPTFEPVKLPRVPALAQGAVIPPNREFLAVLGDQRSGTNIEAPLDTITQAFRSVMAEQGGRSFTVIMEVDKQEFARAVFDGYNYENSRVGVKIGGVR